MRSGRQLGIALYLQSRGRATADQLAEVFEVSARTVLRDVEQLSAAGIPVYTEQGRNGGIAILDGYRTSLTGLSVGESKTVAFFSLPSAAEQLGIERDLTLAREKILAAMTAAMSTPSATVIEGFHVDPVDWYRRVVDPPLLREIAEALWAGRRIRLEYESWTNHSTRVVDPWGLVIKAGVWYLVAASDGATKVFRADRVSALHNTGDVAIKPEPSFRLADFWNEWCEQSERRLRAQVATVRINRAGLDELPRIGAHLVADIKVLEPPNIDGWSLIEIFIEDDAIAARDLMSLGPNIEVITPPALRRAIRVRARGIAQLHT